MAGEVWNNLEISESNMDDNVCISALPLPQITAWNSKKKSENMVVGCLEMLRVLRLHKSYLINARRKFRIIVAQLKGKFQTTCE